ncbi:UvrB/UvrC motif-containing protein [Metabacillus iocasae]|uniref:Protein arginine kinase activator n=1 Tax=Priestia iocasae TaxID=2291674 RepID=A0ABS2R198_9BACI|nr:UvrB/UvrC motif-containing protein [Metabacillus iocasae]MBM7704997.1 protein arginine kinase activator [Metabacillus iocasae]
MICQQCQERPATLHFTKVINGQKSEMHICEYCAKENGEISIHTNSGFSINNLLAGLLNLDKPFTETTSKSFTNNEIKQCPTCGMTYPQFAEIGRFGCADCYTTFKQPLTPFLKRLHGGNYSHNGKIPNRIGSNLHLKKELEAMRLKLKEYIEKEEFEEAAKLRDQIRSLEKKLTANRKGDS